MIPFLLDSIKTTGMCMKNLSLTIVALMLAIPAFAQIYFYDGDIKTDRANLDSDYLSTLKGLLMKINPFAQQFRYMNDVMSRNSHLPGRFFVPSFDSIASQTT